MAALLDENLAELVQSPLPGVMGEVAGDVESVLADNVHSLFEVRDRVLDLPIRVLGRRIGEGGDEPQDVDRDEHPVVLEHGVDVHPVGLQPTVGGDEDVAGAHERIGVLRHACGDVHREVVRVGDVERVLRAGEPEHRTAQLLGGLDDRSVDAHVRAAVQEPDIQIRELPSQVPPDGLEQVTAGDLVGTRRDAPGSALLWLDRAVAVHGEPQDVATTQVVLDGEVVLVGKVDSAVAAVDDTALAELFLVNPFGLESLGVQASDQRIPAQEARHVLLDQHQDDIAISRDETVLGDR